MPALQLTTGNLAFFVISIVSLPFYLNSQSMHLLYHKPQYFSIQKLTRKPSPRVEGGLYRNSDEVEFVGNAFMHSAERMNPFLQHLTIAFGGAAHKGKA